jgi:hypothetical protein
MLDFAGNALGRTESSTLFRRPQPGPELELVSRFRDRLRSSVGHEAVTVFVEPRLKGHYPDLVAVFWDERRAAGWPSARANLTLEEIRYLHRLHTVQRINIDELVCSIGPRKTEQLVSRLLDADVATIHNWHLVRRPLREVFAVTRILAFEAKVRDWRSGLQQAFFNSWFSSETFLLLPDRTDQPAMLDRAAELGVGIITLGQPLARPCVRPRKERVPRSYASWLFNEWVWRRSAALAP